jgi:hypothetical protein
MGRMLTVLGVLVLLIGIAGTAWSFLSPLIDPVNSIFNPAGDAIQAALEGPDAEKLCEPGETIETEEGPPSRTVGDGRRRAQCSGVSQPTGHSRCIPLRSAAGQIRRRSDRQTARVGGSAQ